MDGRRHSLASADGSTIGLMTAGSGPPLLLVHGGMGQIEGWLPLWQHLTRQWTVTAMDRRGRGSSGDTAGYAIEREFDDITAVARELADRHGAAIDVFAHSYGATCTIGAAARGAPFRRVVLYEPPGPQTVPEEWVQRVTSYVSNGHAGRAMVSFLKEIIGLTDEDIEELKRAPRDYDVLAIVSATLAREAEALTTVDLTAAAQTVELPVLLLVGADSPRWAKTITEALATAFAIAEVVVMASVGHEAIGTAPELTVAELQRFLTPARPTPTQVVAPTNYEC